MSIRLKPDVLTGLLAFALITLLGIVQPSALVSLQTRYFDQLQTLQPRTCASLPVTVVDINDASLQALGQWPWPRARIADLVNRIGESGAAAVVLDIVFSEPDRFSPETLAALWPESASVVAAIPDFDQQLADALQRYSVVGSTALLSEVNELKPAVSAGFAVLGDDPRAYLPMFSGALVNIPVLAKHFSAVGSFSVVPGSGSIVRSVSLLQLLGKEYVPGLSIEAVRVAQGAGTLLLKSSDANAIQTGLSSIRAAQISVPVTSAGHMRLHFGACAVPTLSALELFEANASDLGKLDGSIVLIGTSAAALGDFVTTPAGALISGVQVHAQAVEQMLQGWFLYRHPWAGAMEWGAVFIAVLLVIFALVWSGVFVAGALSALFIGIGLALSWWLFNSQHLLIDPILPGMGLLFVYLAQSLFSYFRSERERVRIRQAFGQYLSPDLVNQLAEDPQRLELGGEKREMTFLFSDIAGFTSLTENTSADQLVILLNRYLDGACKIVMENGGTIDKIVGDAIHAMFNAPLDQPDHAERAVTCALELDRFTERFRNTADALEASFGLTRIGINTGTAVVGNFGGEQRFDYTAHGDAINTAARLEAANKQLGTRICVAQSTVDLCQRHDFRPVAAVLLRGKTQAVMVYQPVEPWQLAQAPEVEYLNAWKHLEADRKQAEEEFLALNLSYPNDPLLALQLRRLNDSNWSPVITIQ